MLKFQIPILDSLQPIIEELSIRGVTIYLHGKLGENLLFIDIDWETAEFLQGKITPPWTLIYAYFISSEAVARGEPDPLASKANLKDILSNYKPAGHQELPVEDDVDALVQRAEYLLQFPPSRLVYLGGKSIVEPALQQIVELLSELPE